MLIIVNTKTIRKIADVDLNLNMINEMRFQLFLSKTYRSIMSN